MFEIFKRESKEKRFWDWFVENKSDIENFIDSNSSDYSVYNTLTARIQTYHKLLFPELTKTGDDKYVLIITPDGRKDGVEPTKKLGESSPSIANWVIKKFRQPNDDIALNYDGLEYSSDDIEIIPEIDPKAELVNIHVFIRNMDEDPKKYQTLAFLYLDHILGEFNTITKVGYIDFYHLGDNKRVQQSISILELRALIEKELY